MGRSETVRAPQAAGAETAAGLALERAPVGTIDLVFSDAGGLDHVHAPIWQDVSCLASAGRSLFCSCDETATVERVMLDATRGMAAEHANFALGKLFELPEGPDGEMDIEGLAVSEGYLWVVGSHSLKRRKPRKRGLADMEVRWDANRGFLGRVPLVDRGDGLFEPVTDAGAGRCARMLPMTGSPRTPIRKMLRRDPLVGSFVGLASKENGLDIEGLAARGDTLLLGLRGPVIGGLALIVRIEAKQTKKGRLKPRRLAGGARYALQALDLNGQGIRDLCWHGDRLLVLSGATTDLEALQSVFAVEEYDPNRPIYGVDSLRRVLDLPIRRGSDHAEGLDVMEVGGEPRLVIAYDSPHNDRTDADTKRLTVDLFEIAGGRGQTAASASSKAASVAS